MIEALVSTDRVNVTLSMRSALILAEARRLCKETRGPGVPATLSYWEIRRLMEFDVALD